MTSEQTLVVIKPDGVQRSLVGEVIKRFEQVGLKLVGLKMIHPTREHIEQHYMHEDGWLEAVGNKCIKGYKDANQTPPTDVPEEAGQIILDTLINYLSQSPVVAMVWQGAHSVEIVRKLTGSTEPKSSDVGTIRGDYVHDSFVLANGDNRSVRNVVHASGTHEEAVVEIKHWFDDSEIFEYTNAQEAIMYDVPMEPMKD